MAAKRTGFKELGRGVKTWRKKGRYWEEGPEGGTNEGRHERREGTGRRERRTAVREALKDEIMDGRRFGMMDGENRENRMDGQREGKGSVGPLC